MNIINDVIRRIDSFKNTYYKYSIMPYLFEKVVGTKYCFWTQNINCDKDSKFGFLHKIWIVEQYLPIRDWVLYKEKYFDHNKYTSFNKFEKTTLNSG